MLKNLKLSSKIIVLVSSLIIISSLIYLLVVFLETNKVKKSMVEEFKKVALNETTTITRDIYEMCKVYNNGLQRRLNGSMQMLDELINQQGGLTLSPTEKVDWKAINQLNQSSTNVSLPQMQLGGKWLGNSNSFSTKTPVIDEVSSAFGVTCTIFQKMDDQGNLLRVASTVKTTNGDRAIGTYIPAVNMNGSSNTVAATINRGEIYKGVALVVGRWYSTVYVPIKDGSGKIIGAIYVGVAQDDDPSIRK
ncbi:MAG: Cache 3/Cache 2 fusion domain-containing protein, partial [Victivallales bacterium]|nr:Cache 3/Cache 2 fusion domain-containing protein [Victivallales bacterium]